MAEDRTGVVARLDALEAVHKAATPGPWIQSVHTDGQPIVAGDFDGESCTDLAYVPDSPADAAAIVAEHNSYGHLLAVARGVLARHHPHGRNIWGDEVCAAGHSVLEPWPCPEYLAVAAALGEA